MKKNKKETFQKVDDKQGSRALFGAIIVIVGTGLLLQNIFSWFSFNYAWPFIIIAVGIYLLGGKK